jgi:hypothetical protein
VTPALLGLLGERSAARSKTSRKPVVRKHSKRVEAR